MKPPNPNNSLNDSLLNVKRGFHLPTIQSRTEVTRPTTSILNAKLHTPQPNKAAPIPMTDPAILPPRLHIDNFRKSIFLRNKAVWIIENAFKINIKP